MPLLPLILLIAAAVPPKKENYYDLTPKLYATKKYKMALKPCIYLI
jgi:hypothetical protein